MKTTSIVKGKVIKEEEREFSFSHHSLNQIEVRIVNSKDTSYSAAQLIHDIASYDPSKANNAELADDMRICFAWYSTIKEGYTDVKERVKKYKFSEQDVIRIAKAIYIEIEKRKHEGTMKHEWNPEDMTKHSKELFGIISKPEARQASLASNENEEPNDNVPARIEKLAELEHMQWSHWTEYMLNNLTKENIKRWKGQIKIPYFKLSEKEKESDREWARKALLIIEESKKKKLLDSKDQGCGKAWEVLFAEGMAVQYFEDEDDANYFADSVNKCSTDEGFAKDVIHVKRSFVHRHTKTKRCYPVNKKGIKFKCSRKELELDPEIKTWFRKNLPIYPGGTSDNHDSIELTEFLDKWNSFSIRKPFISLVGSLANWERTEGDIDILVKAHDPSSLLEALNRAIARCFQIGEEQMADVLAQAIQFIHTDSLFLAAQWRIERAFPEWSDRLHILDDSFSGPFTNFVDLSDLAAVAREEKTREEMAQMKKLKLFTWFPMLKPLHGRKKGEIYSVDSVIETIESRKEDWFETGVYVEKKFDGVHTQAHVAKDYESGKVVRIITEEGTKITKNCPTLRDELRKISGEFILCGEIELWKEGKHQPRADCAGVLNSKEVHPDEKYLRFNIFDKLWHKGKDIHDLPFSERIHRLDQIANTDHVKKTKRVLCNSEAEVRKAIEKVSKEEGSEGAYLKKADFIYELDGKTLNNIKYKLEISLDAVVLKKNKVAKTKQTFYYHCGLRDDSNIVYCGKTFNTNIDAKEGDIIKVIFVDISGYTDPETKTRWVNWWSPRVSMLRTDKKTPDSIDTAWRMVKQTTGRFEDKKMPDIKHLEQLETKGKRFVLQHHFRGASEHIDFRVQINHVLEGFTLAAQHPDLLKATLNKHWELEKGKDIYSLYWGGEPAYLLDKKEKITKEPSAALKKKIFDLHVLLHKDPKYWKVDMETGEEKKRKAAVDGTKQVEKIFCVKKGKEPYEWLDIEGVTKPREIEPEPGGTRYYPGIFVEIDSGVYYPGAQKPYFKEYFLDSKKWKGRFVFRLVAGLKGTKAVSNWLYWKPTDQSPYVLSSRAIKDNWLPIEGSAMPPEWERKLPEELAYWNAKERKKKIELRKLAHQYLKKKELLSEEKEETFILTNRNWKGQYVVRGIPFEDYHLKIKSKKFHLDKDPSSKMPEVGLSALAFEGKEGYFKPGKKDPKTEVNPNLKIPAFIEVIDEGKAEIIADEPLYLHVRFKGKSLKGLYYLRRTSRESEFWTFKKGMQSF